MTTIVFKDGILASDSGTFINDEIVNNNSNKMLSFPSHGIVYGFAGTLNQIVKVRNYLTILHDKNEKTPFPEIDDVSVLQIRYFNNGHYTIKEADNNEFLSFVDLPYYAIGSGAILALTALDANPKLTAKETIEIVKKRHAFTAGEVREYDIKKHYENSMKYRDIILKNKKKKWWF